MKILVIHNILWAHYKSVLFEAMFKNAPKNCEIYVVQLAKNEISRKSLPDSDYPYSYPYTLLFNSYQEEINPVKKVFALLNFIFRYNPDLINVTGYSVDISMTLAIFFGRLLGKKVVISTESTVIEQTRNRIKEFVKSLIVKSAHGFICFGTTSEDYILNLGAKKNQILENKSAVVDDKYILNRFKLAKANNLRIPGINTKYNFIFVGRLVEVKNLPLLIQAFENIKKQVSQANDWGLVILGDGDLKDELVMLNSHIPSLYFLPSVSWNEVPDYFAVSSVLVLPSTSEAWGLVVNEAMICGLPVIVSDHCGSAKDLVKENGIIFKSENLESLQNAMEYMILNTEKLQIMGENSKRIIKDFCVDKVSKRIVEKFVILGNK